MAIQRIALLLIIILSYAAVSAQPVTVSKSEVKVTEEGKTFYVHTVAPGQTLFSISRAYEVDQSEIIRHNPAAAAGLLAGQELRIPDLSAPVANKEKSTAGGSEFLIHTVAAGETLFGISRKYGITTQQIITANPNATNFENLRIGQELRIPVSSMLGEAVTVTVVQKVKDSVIIHNVQRGESVFGIARQYGVHSDSIIAWNPELKEQPLKRGQDIRIIIRIQKPVHVSDTTVAATFIYDTILYQIQERETIYGLARRYNTTVEMILALNPELQDGLKAGNFIYIPVPKGTRPAATTPTTPVATPAGAKGCENSRYKPKYKVALMIPLYLDEIDRIHITPPTDEQISKTFFVPFRFLEFYEGFLIAVDSMKKAGLSIDLHVYDTANDSIKVKRILARPELQYMDMIIGPFFTNNYNFVAKFAVKHNIKIISPFVRMPKLLSQHSNIFQMNASSETKMRELAGHIASTHQDFNLIFVTSNNKDDKELANIFRLSLEASTATFAKKPQYTEVAYSERGFSGVSTRLDVNKQNIIINLITGETMISNYVTNIAKLTKNFDITMYGLPEWQSYRTFDLADLMAVKLHLFDNTFVDYDNPNTIAFLREFRNRYKSEPEESNYGFLGYDIGLYFLKALHDYGLDFENCFGRMIYNPISTGFYWKQINGKGFENGYLNIYRYDDFKLEPVKHLR